jgi:two-component system OmpR family sensor kinase
MRRLGHRARLAAVSAVTAGLLLAGVFAAVVVVMSRSEMGEAQALLDRVLRQAAAEVAASPTNPDLSEVAASDPNLTLAAFAPDGRLIAKSGRLNVSPDANRGVGRLREGTPVMIASQLQGATRILGVEVLATREQSIRKLAILLALLWLPLTASAGLVTWFAANATFRPLIALADQAERLSDDSLSERLNVDGEDEYGVFVARLNRFLDRLEQSVHRQQQFVADAAHELRTPLTVMRSRIELTLRRRRTDQEYREALNIALHEAERLSSLVEALLQTAAPSPEPADETDLEIACERAHARWVDRYAESQVRLDLDTEPVIVSVLSAQIDVLLDNLLSNALRVSPPDSVCRLNVVQMGGTMARITLDDEGPGIPPGLEERIFERFARMDSGRNRGDGGFGIGLAVCRKLVTARGGIIRAERGEKGARFVVDFPVA